MNEENVKSIIALQRINNHLLVLIDSKKNTENISLKQILDLVYEPYEKIENNYRHNHSFFNQYQMISSLYTYIVLPKETFFNSIPENTLTNSLIDAWGINKIIPSCELKYFIRRVRNAVSHGNIEFTEKLEFTFTDINPKNKEDKFQIKLSGEQLLKFTRALAYWCLTQDIDLKNLEEST